MKDEARDRWKVKMDHGPILSFQAQDLEGDPEVSARVLIASRRMLEGFDTHRETTRTDDFLCL